MKLEDLEPFFIGVMLKHCSIASWNLGIPSFAQKNLQTQFVVSEATSQ